MKKIVALAVTFLILTLTSCSSRDVGTKEVTVEEPIIADTISYDAEALVSAYQKDRWDGEFISNEKHCASIENGRLWIDCQTTSMIPDMSEQYHANILAHSPEGTWVHDFATKVELWKKGSLLKEIQLKEYCDDVFKMENAIVARNGEFIWVYNLNGSNIQVIDSVVDIHQSKEGLMYSKFNHTNCLIDQSGTVQLLDTNFVHFPRENVQVVKSDVGEFITQLIELYHSGWDGTLKVVDGKFVTVDYNGDIIVNNKVIGNVSLGEEYFAKEGSNISLNKEKSYWLNGKELVIFEKGEQTAIDIPDGEGEILWESDSGVVLWLYGQHGNTLVVVYPDGTTKTLSTKAIDANVAYHTLYYMEDDIVYGINWEKQFVNPNKFFEGAYAVCPYKDESMGALVPKEQANYHAGGYSNIYSPYGK